eukprot:1386766-Rhodomonas_salina.1
MRRVREALRRASRRKEMQQKLSGVREGEVRKKQERLAEMARREADVRAAGLRVFESCGLRFQGLGEQWCGVVCRQVVSLVMLAVVDRCGHQSLQCCFRCQRGAGCAASADVGEMLLYAHEAEAFDDDDERVTT